MKIDRVELIHLRLPLRRPFETAFGRMQEHDSLLVRAESQGLVGWGEVPAGAAPRGSPETVHTAWHVIRDFLAPRLRGKEFSGPGPVSELFGAVRGHNMAKAGIEMAALDLFAKLLRKPLHEVLGGTRTEVPAGISLGIGDSVGDLLKRIEEALAKRYARVRVRIKPGWDVGVIAEVRRAFPALPLMAACGSAYTLQDVDHLRKLDEFDLMMLEQPLGWDDLIDHAKLQARLKTPVCLDDSVRSYDDARRALEIGACRILCVRTAGVSGPYPAKMIHNLCKARGIPVWCGSFIETGVGRAHTLALSTLPGFTLPGDLAADEHGFVEDVVDPPVAVSPQGTVLVPPGPGIGYTVVESRLAQTCVRRELVLS